MNVGRLALASLVSVLLLLAVVFLSVLWLPSLLLLALVALALWVVRHYYLDYLDEPEAR